VRPGKPNKAASSFASSIIREPLQGAQVICPVGKETGVWVLSPRKVVENFLHAEALPADVWGTSRAVSLPGLTITVKEMIDTLRSLAGDSVADRIRWQADAEVERIVYGWPVRFAQARALAMGFSADSGFHDIIEAFINDDLDGTFVE